MLTNIRKKLHGKKTYIVAATAFLSTVGMWVDGEMTNEVFVQTIVTAALATTLRAGVANSAESIKNTEKCQ